MKEENKRVLKKFYEHLKQNQLSKEEVQESSGHGSKKYTADMWTLEVCELILEIEAKHRCPESRCLQKSLLLNSLKEVKDDADTICIGEVGRGLDIIISNMVKEWKVICYDHNSIYDKYLDKYFNTDFYPISTTEFLANLSKYIKEKTIFIIDNTRCRDFKTLEENENIVHLIFYGKLLW